ncbi:MAG: hypothetical protein R3F43_06725 [bacterium]
MAAPTPLERAVEGERSEEKSRQPEPPAPPLADLEEDTPPEAQTRGDVKAIPMGAATASEGLLQAAIERKDLAGRGEGGLDAKAAEVGDALSAKGDDGGGADDGDGAEDANKNRNEGDTARRSKRRAPATRLAGAVEKPDPQPDPKPADGLDDKKEPPPRKAAKAETLKKEYAFDLDGEPEGGEFAPPPPVAPAPRKTVPGQPAAFPEEEKAPQREARQRGPVPRTPNQAAVAEEPAVGGLAEGAAGGDALADDGVAQRDEFAALKAKDADRRPPQDEPAEADEAEPVVTEVVTAETGAAPAPQAAPAPDLTVGWNADAPAGGSAGAAPPRPEPQDQPAAVRAGADAEDARVAAPAAGRKASAAEVGGTPAPLREARAARQRGDHAAAVEAYQRYFSSYGGDDQFAMSMIEAARSYESLGDTTRALQLYRLAAASDDPTVKSLARQRIAALESLKRKQAAPRAARPAAVDALEEAPAAPQPAEEQAPEKE